MSGSWFCVDDERFVSALSKLRELGVELPDDPDAATDALHDAMYWRGWLPRPVDDRPGIGAKVLIPIPDSEEVLVVSAMAASMPCAMVIVLAQAIEEAKSLTD